MYLHTIRSMTNLKASFVALTALLSHQALATDALTDAQDQAGALLGSSQRFATHSASPSREFASVDGKPLMDAQFQARRMLDPPNGADTRRALDQDFALSRTTWWRGRGQPDAGEMARRMLLASRSP